MVETEAGVVCYRIDGSQGRFAVQAFAEGLLSSFGHNPTIAIRDFSGQVCFEPGTFASASLELLVKADSLTVTDDVSEKDRKEIERMMREDVLETAKYAEIVYNSSNITAQRVYEGMYRVKMDGELTLHGVTRPQTIEGQVTLSESSLRVRGECRLKQADFKIKKISVAGGTLKVKDEVKLSFEIVAQKS
jgi:polyisoprenoid-binding protein YceI